MGPKKLHWVEAYLWDFGVAVAIPGLGVRPTAHRLVAQRIPPN